MRNSCAQVIDSVKITPNRSIIISSAFAHAKYMQFFIQLLIDDKVIFRPSNTKQSHDSSLDLNEFSSY